MEDGFSEEQKQYLQGFMAGVVQSGGLPFVGMTGAGLVTGDRSEAVSDLARPDAGAVHGTPVDELAPQERAKLEKSPFRMWDDVVANAEAGRFPTGDDVFRYKALGLFYVAPAQDSFMLRCRIPGGVLAATQLRALAQIADAYGGGYADLTTRANVQIREIGARDAVNVLTALCDAGLTSRGAGADNLRNITASPTAGFDPQELYDVRTLARSMHHYILNSPDLYDLPRKFNIAFDGGGAVSAAASTNDVAFTAIQVGGEVYFELGLGGITGHGDFARSTGVMVPPHQTVALAAAVIRVYLENGDRTNRKRARLKYLLDRWGLPRFVDEVRKRTAFPLLEVPEEGVKRREPLRHSHLGFHTQKQEGRVYAGLFVPVGRLTVDQMLALADVASAYGSGEIRLTVFQNLLIPDIADENVGAVTDHVRAAGLRFEASSIRAGIVACTGSAGCQYANAATKSDAQAIGEYLDRHVTIDEPFNLHLTGCTHSCAQHYCGDIGLLGARVKTDSGSVDGYHVYVGGGMDTGAGIGRKVASAVPATDVPELIRRMLEGYLAERTTGETFAQFTRRLSDEALSSALRIQN